MQVVVAARATHRELRYLGQNLVSQADGGHGYRAVLVLLRTESDHDDAIRALEVLAEPLKDFPWLTASDKSTALAAILTALVRPVLRTAPLFAFRAPKMGAGKSLLADVVSMIATGRTANAMTQGQD